MVSSLGKVTGSIEATTCFITLITAILTLGFIYMKKGSRFLLYMSWILVVISLIGAIDGLVTLEVLEQGAEVYKQSKSAYYAIIGVCIGIHEVGVLQIMWFVTFKYWETARQFSRMIRILQASVIESENGLD